MGTLQSCSRKLGTTFLKIGVLPADGSAPVIEHQLGGQEAYDSWYLAHYFREVLAYRQLQAGGVTDLSQIPRKEKNLLLYLVLAARPELHTVLELGSSLFEMIDGLELVGRYLKSARSRIRQADLKGLSYIGIERSALLSFASSVLHPDHRITLHRSGAEVTGKYDVLYDRIVGNYAFETVRGLADFINRSTVALLNLFLSKGETFVSYRLGQSFTYFSLEEVVRYLDKPLYHLFGAKAPLPASARDPAEGRPVVEGFFLCCQPEFAAEFMTTAQQDPEIRSYFAEKRIEPKEAIALLADR